MSLKPKIAAATAAAVIAISASFIQPFEGTALVPYRDTVNVWTVCTGHTGKDVIRNKTYSKQECDALFRSDLGVALDGVNRRLTLDVPDTTRAAFTSFVFNVGESKFASSTMLKLANKGDLVGACHQLTAWRYAGGQDCSVRANGCYGIWLRRQAEKSLCLTDLQ